MGPKLWRGVGLVHIPTTLLAMVDSAHGGKTAVNLRSTKNQLGSFYPADQIWIVRSVVDSLSKKLIAEGMAELIKACLIGDPGLSKQYFQKWVYGLPLYSSIRKAIAVKERVAPSSSH